jgi:type I restriction enzyme S subunit
MSDGWSQTTIGEIARVVGGGTPRTNVPEYWGGDIPWITPTEVVANPGRAIVKTERTITDEGLAHSGAQMLPEGTVLLTSRATIGAVALAGRPLATNQGFASLVPESSVLARFLMYWCEAHKDEFVARAGGNTFLEVSKGNVASVPILLPPLDDQRRIVDLVSTLDALFIAALAVGEATSGIATSLRVEVFDADDTVAVPLGAFCDPDGIQIGPFGSQLHASDYIPDGVPIVMPRDLADGRIHHPSVVSVAPEHAARLRKHRLRVGDIVLPRRGDLTKRALVTDDEEGWLCGTGSVRVRVTHVDPHVVFQALSVPAIDDWLSDNSVGVTMPNLNTEIVSRIPVKIVQNAELVVDVLEALLATRDNATLLMRSASATRTALLADLLSGNHRIRDSYDALLEAV